MSFHKIRTLVIEDEAPIRHELIQAINEVPELEVVGEADAVESGFHLIKNTPSDLLFLDIKLIGGNAFQLLALLAREGVLCPPVVINTGYRDFEYAQKLHNDYGDKIIAILKKPFYEDWEKHQGLIMDSLYIRQQQERFNSGTDIVPRFVTIQNGKQSYFVALSDIILIKTGDKGQGKTEVILEHSILQCAVTLSKMMMKLPNNFVQINRYEVINFDWISVVDHLNKEVIMRNGDSFIIGSGYYPDLCKKLGL